MPLNGNTYVAPTWRNGQPPALDPTELQAISDTLAAAQSKNVSQDSLIAALQTAVGGKAQIEIGSYVGTGTYGASNPNSITCSFAPKLIWIYGVKAYSESTASLDFYSNSALNILIPDYLTTEFVARNGFLRRSGNWLTSDLIKRTYAKKSNDGKTVSWYIDTSGITITGDGPAYAQLNSQGVVFLYIVFA